MDRILKKHRKPIPITVLSDNSVTESFTETTKNSYTTKKCHRRKCLSKHGFKIKQQLEVVRQRFKCIINIETDLQEKDINERKHKRSKKCYKKSKERQINAKVCAKNYKLKSKERILPQCLRGKCGHSTKKQDKESNNHTRKSGLGKKRCKRCLRKRKQQKIQNIPKYYQTQTQETKEHIMRKEERGRILLSPVSSPSFWTEESNVYEDISSDSFFSDIETLIKRAKQREQRTEVEENKTLLLNDHNDKFLSKEDKASICSETTVLLNSVKSAYSPALTTEDSNLCWKNWKIPEDKLGCSPFPEYSPKYSDISDETVILTQRHFNKVSTELNFEDENTSNTREINFNKNTDIIKRYQFEDKEIFYSNNNIETIFKSNDAQSTKQSKNGFVNKINIKKEPVSPNGPYESNMLLEQKINSDHFIKLKIEKDEFNATYVETNAYENGKYYKDNFHFKVKSEKVDIAYSPTMSPCNFYNSDLNANKYETISDIKIKFKTES